jgi:hypothetical protein
MRFECVHALARGNVPDADFAVGSARNKMAEIPMTARQAVDGFGVAIE